MQKQVWFRAALILIREAVLVSTRRRFPGASSTRTNKIRGYLDVLALGELSAEESLEVATALAQIAQEARTANLVVATDIASVAQTLTLRSFTSAPA